MLSSDDMAAHFASEVFVIYLPARSSTDSLALADRICETIAQYNFKINGSCLPPPAASVSTMRVTAMKTPCRFCRMLIAPVKPPVSGRQPG